MSSIEVALRMASEGLEAGRNGDEFGEDIHGKFMSNSC